MRLEDHPRWQWQTCMPVDTGNGIVSPLAFTTEGGSHLRLANGLERPTARCSLAASHPAAEGFLRAMLDEAVAELNARDGWSAFIRGDGAGDDPQDIAVMVERSRVVAMSRGPVPVTSSAGHTGEGGTRGERLYSLVGTLWALMDREATR